MKATATVFFDTRRAKQNEKFPVKIQIYFNRERKYYRTRFEFSKEEFSMLYAPKIKEPFKSNRSELDELITKAEEIIDKLGSYFTIDLFDKKYLLNRKDRGNVFAVYEEVINELEKNEQIGTATTYKNSLQSLKTFIKKETLKFEQVTVDLLKKYEKWMLTEGNMRITKQGKKKEKRGVSKNTLGMYLRTLRTIYNKGIAEGEIPEIAYPFGKNGYVIPSGRNFKRALELEDVEKILKYEPKDQNNQTLLFSRDIWIFTYLGNGINLKDIANLKYKDLQNDLIVFVRAKTANTKKENQVQVKIDLDEHLKAIINRWGIWNKNPDNYIFPILSNNMSALQQHKRIKQVIKTVNKYVKRIGRELGIELNLTTYVARHSFATALKDIGASPLIISELMGNSEQTARNYLGDLRDMKRKELRKALTAFSSEVA